MRFKSGLLAASAMAIGIVASPAQAATGWYFQLGAGVNWIQDGSVDERTVGGALSTADQFNYDTGFVVASAIGYDWGRWRAEFEVAYRHNDVDGFCSTFGCSTIAGADVWELSQMVNVLYDIPLGGRWSASVGAGIGGNLVVMNPGGSGNFDSSNLGIEADDYVLAGQLIAQAAYQLSDRWQLFLDYHFMIMDDPKLQDPTGPEYWEMEKTDHSVMLGVRFDLQRDGSAPLPPVVDNTPPPKAPKQFIVFFGFNKSNLTAEAARVVADAAAAAKEYGSASIAIVGHTDTVGSNQYNQRLSMRRAEAVKSGLQSNGIPAGAITTAGRGETELMVQTGDGVKEPQNRRATIDLE